MARAETDQTFRQRLLADPIPAIQEVFGVVIPNNFRIRFIERDAAVDALVVLPDFRASADELSDADLNQVAGGVHANAALAWKKAVRAHQSHRI